MKQFFMILLLGLLVGCSAITARQFDPVEYNYAITIAANSTHAVHLCSTKGPDYYNYLTLMNHDSFVLTEYVANKNDKMQALPAANQLRDITLSFLLHKSDSVDYCQLKLGNIQGSARMYARSVGYDYSYDPCSGDAATRLALFKSAHDAKKISDDDFKDLTTDILRLQTIDKSSCTLESSKKLNDLLDDAKTALSLVTF